MKLTWILALLFFGSCNTNDSNGVTTTKILRMDSLRTKLIGHWGGLREDSPIWEIKIDSIYYFEERKTYPYQIVDKDLVIVRPEATACLRNISVVDDTLTFSDEQGLTIRGYRFKTKE